jgi:4-amino-4-deoxy-L-arabinose transferase-like glycosyltransferase
MTISLQKRYDIIVWLIVIVAFIPILTLRDLTPDNELRYVNIAEEALRSGNLFAFTLNGEPYADKPPFYLWLVILCRLISGKYLVWQLSLLSFIPAIGVCLIMEKWASGLLNFGQRVTARLMLMSSIYFIGASVVARMGMLMTLFITLSLYTFWKLYRHEAKAIDRWLFPVYLFMAVFTKGPLGFLIPLVTIMGFLSYKHLIHMWYELAPWSFLVVGVVIACLLRHVRLSDLEAFFVIAVILPFVLLSLISAKLPIYLLPVSPFSIFLSVSLLPRFIGKKWVEACLVIPAALLSLVLPAIAIAYVVYPLVQQYCSFFIWLAGACFSIAGILVLYQLRHSYRLNITLRTLAIGMFASLFFIGCAMPQLNGFMGH